MTDRTTPIATDEPTDEQTSAAAVTVAVPPDPKKLRTVALICTAMTFSMLGLAFAAVPFYDWFCRATGYDGTTNVATSAPNVVGEREFEIRFDSNVFAGLPWRFTPVEKSVNVHVGEVKTVEYEIENLSDKELSATAGYNVTPGLAGYYFTKLVCFCFSEQTLKPHEKIRVPVTFFVDSSIDEVKDLRGAKTITLSYTFFAAKTPTKPLAAVDGTKAPDKL
jgi:cytochrome c oxidase assembly protein subunit 11